MRCLWLTVAIAFFACTAAQGQDKPKPTKPGIKPSALEKKPGEKKPASSKPGVPDKNSAQFAPVIDTTPRRDPRPLAAAIDKLIDEKLKKDGILPSPPADDAEFVRRPALDIVGRIPTYEEAVALLDSDDPQRRSRWIDELLASPMYGEHFGTIWRELIAPRDPGGAKVAHDPFTPWLADQFNRNRSWDAVVRELIAVEGKIRELPQAGFVMANTDNGEPKANLLADATARLFWGVQLRVAECHDHPFAPWKQADFWGTAAFFSRVRKGYADGKNPLGWTLTEEAPQDDVNRQFSGTLLAAPGVAGPAIVVPETGGKLAKEVVPAKFLSAEQPAWTDEGPYRPRFADWATGQDNPYFAANTANRLWHHFFGRGLVHPLDGFQAENPPSHPEVLDLLAGELKETDFDLKHLVRVICHTRAYQRTSRPIAGNETDVAHFSRPAVKIMRPEMLYDSLSIVINPPVRKSGSKPGQAIRPQPLPATPRGEFIVMFGSRPDENEGSIVNTGLPQFLRLMNGPLLNGNSPALDRFAKSGVPAEEVIESLYLSAYARRPTEDELQTASAYIRDHDDPREAYAGLLWALVNGAGFVLNH